MKTKNKKPTTFGKIFGVIYASLTAIIIAIIIISFTQNIDLKDNKGDILNWVTLTIEIGLAVAISVAILVYSDSQQKRMSELLDTQKKIIDEQYARETKRKTVYSQRIIQNLRGIKERHLALRQWLANYLTNDDSIQNKNNIIESTRRNGDYVLHYAIPHVKDEIEFIAELFDDPLLAMNLTAQCTMFEAFFKEPENEENWKKDTITARINSIDHVSESIDVMIQRIEIELNKIKNNVIKENN